MDEIARLQPFVDGGRLLVEDHPRIEGGADDGRDQKQKLAVADGKVDRVPRQRREPGVSLPRDDEKRQLEQADDERDPLDALIGAAGDDDEQSRGRQWQGEAALEAKELADASDAGELGDERPDDRRGEPQGRNIGPADAKPFADEFAVAAAGVEPEPHGQFLNHVQHRNEHKHQRQQAIAPLSAGLGRGHDIAGVGVGQHHEEARPPDRKRAGEGGGADGARLRFGLHPCSSP